MTFGTALVEPEKLIRGKHCGLWTTEGRLPNGGRQFHRLNCKCWKCSYCGPRKAKRVKRAIRQLAEELKLQRFVTLTLDPSKIRGNPVKYLSRCFADLRVYLRREHGVAPKYIRVLEFQKNGNPHLHILIDRFIPQAWLKAAWTAAGGGRFVDIRFIDVHRVSRYLSKYLTKELLMSAPRRSRRVTTAHGMHLFEKRKDPDASYRLVRIDIDRLFRFYAADVTVAEFDDEERLASFATGPPRALLAA